MTVKPTTQQPRVGIVGAGFMAAVHSKAARAAGAQLVGLVASSPQRSQQAATELGIRRGYPSVDDLLEDVDVLHVCTPNALHADQASAAIAAGKHVVCEKPLATTTADAQRMVDDASAAKIVATVPFVYRFHPLVREARDRFADGRAGQLLTVQGSYLQDWLLDPAADNWRVDAAEGGPSRAFADIGSHLVDLLEFVTCDRVSRLAAAKRTFFGERGDRAVVDTEDAVALVVETAGGAIGTLLVSQVAAGRKNRLHLEIAGSKENIAFDQEQPETLWIGRRSSTEILARAPETVGPQAARLSVLPAGHPQGLTDAFTAFVTDTYSAVAGDPVPDGLPTFRDGLRAAQVLDAVFAATASGHWTDVEGISA